MPRDKRMVKEIKVLSLFSGYGGDKFGLKKVNIPFKCVGFSEVDKFAIQCHEQNHKGKNYGDVTKINPDELPDFDLLTGGFPCQAFSVAGKGLGELDTRGTLFNDIIRIAAVKKPRYMLLENVKGLTSKKHKETFNKILSELKRIGYFVHWQIYNSKEYGIPQNRERVFFVCFRNQEDFWQFIPPKKEELKIFLKDILEENVDNKYYLSEKCVNKLKKTGFRGLKDDISSCITTENYKLGFGTNCIRQINNPKHSNDRVYSQEGISPTLNTMNGGNRQPFIAASRGRNPKNPSDRTVGTETEQRLEPKLDGTSNTISTVQKDNYVCEPKTLCINSKDKNGKQPKIQNRVYSSKRVSPAVVTAFMPSIENNLSIRKLTPTECFRLMGFLDDEINLEGLSNTQRYKLAGNGWCVQTVSKIFYQMFKNTKYLNK